MHRWVVFLSLNNFYVTAERTFYPELKKKAIVVVRGGKILDISLEAERKGIHSGLSLNHLRSIPRVFILPYNEEHYLPLYHRIWSLISNLQESSNYVTKVEPLDFHVGFIQLAQSMVPKEILRRIKEELLKFAELKSKAGGGPNKLIARLSARWEMIIPEDEVDRFLMSVPLGSLDWLDLRIIKRLNRLGVVTIGEIRSIPEEFLKKEFPQHAHLLSCIGKGVDQNPVISSYPPEQEEKVVELEGESNYRVLMQYLSLCSQELSKTLYSRKEEALELELVFSEGKEEKKGRKKLLNPISTHEEILRISSQLLRRIWRGREIYTIKIVLLQLRRRFEEFCGDVNQLELIHTERKTGLYKEFRRIPQIREEELLERIRRKYGSSIIGFKRRRRRMAELIFETKGKYLL